LGCLIRLEISLIGSAIEMCGTAKGMARPTREEIPQNLVLLETDRRWGQAF
jgi:hypothetical protein